MSLYRGAGGASDATDDSTVNAVAGYASSAASSATAAATSATNASNNASASAASASNSSNSAYQAQVFTDSAQSAAFVANTAAGEAFNSATLSNIARGQAQTAAGQASTYSSQALGYRNTASTHATNAANSSETATSQAIAAGVSAAQALAIYGNTTAMNNAVTSAATSATTATTQATNAASSATAAASSASSAASAVSSASSYADSAQNSANDAQAYATSALSARDATLAAYDSFDDRYLGVKSADPTVDNDGNPLIAGSLYFNNQTNMMMLRAGGAWVAAYTSGGSPSFGNTVVNGTLNVTGAVTLSGGTANSVAYLNGSKVLTSGSALTFDGTNLGIGTSSPTAKLHVGWGNDQFQVTNPATGSKRLGASYTGYVSGNIYSAIDLNSAGTSGGDISFSVTASGGSLTTAMRLSEAGNLGLGVTPSAWGSSYKVLQFAWATLASENTASGQAILANNAYNTGSVSSPAWKYSANANSANLYVMDALTASHKWYIAPSGTAGNAITFTQAMTLNSSGNLLVGTTSSGARVTVQDTNNAISAGVTNGVFLLREVGGSSANNTLELNVRPNSGKSGYLTFTESGVADRWSIGIAAGDSGLLFRSGIAGTERMRLDSSGNLGLGVTPSAWALFTGNLELNNGNTFSGNAAQNSLTQNAYYGSGGWTYKTTAAASRYQQISGAHAWHTAASGTAGNAISFTQAMTLDASGNLLVGKTAWGSASTNGAYIGTGWAGFSYNGDGLYLNRNVSDGNIVYLSRSGTLVGTINVTTTATTYNTSSDYRLKENIAPMTGALAKVAALKPCTYKWKADGSDGEGFIAHELAEVCPHAVTGEKDAVDEDGNPKYQGIDVSFLVATLTAAIQEQQAIINDLRARVAQLESN